MRVNSVIHEISKGYWAINPAVLPFWASIVNQLFAREEFRLEGEKQSMVTVFDKQNRVVPPNDSGMQEVPPGSVAVINIMGILVRYGDMCVYGAEDYVRTLYNIEANPNFIGAVGYFDGPGGAVGSISPFVQFGKVRKKSYVGLYETACSAHAFSMYPWVDHIMAENDLSATIGSHGVVFSAKDDKKFLESQGFTFLEIYPDESEDKNLPVRLALEGKFDLIKKEMLSPMALKLQEIVTSNRPNLKADAPGVLTGKVFYAPQAIEYGLVDSIGNLEAAIARVRVLDEMKKLKKK
ncbi:S49 family peptidase [Flavobacterium sp. RHBU_3]|uniref:S49 family peptidase n=1 Tax=Flavobacterium sp. RHBU_3 TaxID=3391184 RepID=UPI0039850F74